MFEQQVQVHENIDRIGLKFFGVFSYFLHFKMCLSIYCELIKFS